MGGMAEHMAIPRWRDGPHSHVVGGWQNLVRRPTVGDISRYSEYPLSIQANKRMNIPDSSVEDRAPSSAVHTGFKLFVYGTLKRGYWNHEQFCARAQSICPAAVWGRLYHLYAGFPALDVSEDTILAYGTADPVADACKQQATDCLSFDRPPGDWDMVRGELVVFANPIRDLPPIDRLEGFRPGKHCMYQRVMVPAQCAGHIVPVWTYWMPGPHDAIRVTGGWWSSP